jgi:hypothetical protein
MSEISTISLAKDDTVDKQPANPNDSARREENTQDESTPMDLAVIAFIVADITLPRKFAASVPRGSHCQLLCVIFRLKVDNFHRRTVPNGPKQQDSHNCRYHSIPQ